MRLLSTALLLLFVCLNPAGAQVARWIILPVHQNVEKPAGVDAFVCHDGDTTSLFSLHGELLGVTTDEVKDFQEDKAVTVRRGTQTITGFYSVDGRYVNLKPCEVYRDYPYFSGGYLIVQQGKNYFYIDSDGKFWKQGQVNLPARVKAPPTPTYVTRLQVNAGHNGKLGLSFDGKEILAPQFDEVQRTMTDLAMVRTGSRWGVIGVDSLATFRPLLNEGNDIWLRHHSEETVISIKMPSYMDARKVRLTMTDNSEGIKIDEQSRTIDGSTIRYSCQVSMPPTMLTDSIDVAYTVGLEYDGVKLQQLPLTACLRYEGGRFSVDELSDGAFEGNGYAFTINVKEHNQQPGDEAYPYEVEVMSGDLPSSLTPLSASRYRCRLHRLDKDNNNVYVVVREEGCPPSVFPFEISVKRPAQKSGGKSQVTIRKKETPKPAKPAEPKKPIKLL